MRAHVYQRHPQHVWLNLLEPNLASPSWGWTFSTPHLNHHAAVPACWLHPQQGLGLNVTVMPCYAPAAATAAPAAPCDPRHWLEPAHS